MNILIADDEPLVRRALQKALVKNAHTVTIAEDGLQALSLINSNNYDLIVLDVLMPGLSGPAVIRAMRPVPVKKVLISAYKGTEEENKWDDLQIDLFISKPFDNIMEVVSRLEGIGS